MKTMNAQPVSIKNFSEFGNVILLDESVKPDTESDIQKYYGTLAIINCSGSMQIGICAAKKRPLVVEEMEQHVETAEFLAALKGDFLIPVARSIKKDSREVPDCENIRAFRVKAGEGIVFKPGVWHWTPYAIGDFCEVLVEFKAGTPQNDFISCKLDEAYEIK